ncbi:SusC/RagA family TonB-linked outer membrane protein [Parapedobacter koreensis]|uniref:TonB-linked outer membrane protein, SusC/RagA family n=1 Tax=Parapedobacter koreensis TaxID=332977 RepID=A0A1H7G8C9_9SPHI|nr:SusC/RagA family TonB-linked outer membrane protein [Parapedobacter koreensis]SEK34576.1 TonB-linked outer membrane protein, SusC/RagA family [Parapedobacter koreensis]
MKQFFLFLNCLVFLVLCANAQQKAITGIVMSAEDRLPIPGATVKVEGTGVATQTDENGSFRLEAAVGATLIASSIGFGEHRLQVGGDNYYEIRLINDTEDLDEVVVTALGISRQKKSLGYASQEISGDLVNQVPTGNITNNLSGRAAGVQITRNNNFGGSTNVIIRGSTSLTGNNQALWVVDGVPIDNTTYNSGGQTTGGGGYDYGNLASDINPDDVESINVLKGAAATALYGSRAANGAIIITTKRGSQRTRSSIEVSSSVTFGAIDKSTWPKFQWEYGAGYEKIYGPNRDQFFNEEDVNGDGVPDLVSPLAVYGSFGGPYDSDLLVYQWNAFDPESPYYMQATPWVAPANDPIAFFETPINNTNNVSLSGSAGDAGTYRFSYTNANQKGLQPNSNIRRNNFFMNGSFKLNERLTVTGSGTFSKNDAVGRNETGNESGSNGGNFVAVVRQWWQNNVDVLQLKDAYLTTKRNVTNFIGGTIGNPYWQRYENFQSDTRNRFYGNMGLNFKVTDWLNIDGRVSVDTYSYLQEGRVNNGTLNEVGSYQRRDIDATEFNYDLMANFNKNFGEKFNVSGLAGINIRRNTLRSVQMQTNGGLIVDRLYAISNSLNPPNAPNEQETKIGIDGIYGMVSLGYADTYFLDVTGRSDHASTLPEENSTFFYPSITGSFIFSNLIQSDILSFGKLRLNYAEVGSSAPANSLVDVLQKPTPYGSVPFYSVSSRKNNARLLPELTKSYEGGLELAFLGRRLSADISLYQTNTINQIIPVSISTVTGFGSKYVNSGEVENKGVEVVLSGTPVRKENFSWDITLNWAKNVNKVLSLYEGVDNLQIGSSRGSVSLNASIGEPYGTLRSSDFIYLNGKRVINQTNGEYERTSASNYVVGNVNPDWRAGLSNNFRYRSISVSFLIDMQRGGDIFSSDMAYGYRSGLYENTIGLNDLGNPMRNSLEDGGGIILDGVAPDGSVNTVRTRMDTYNNALGVVKAPGAFFVYDASFVKLREVAVSYTLPSRLLRDTFIRSISVSAIGSNLWIIHKNLPYSDPEAGMSAGNYQGYQLGPMPTTRDFGFNVKLQF